ncbi:hypothetical protein Goari_024880, partial [Gossypium aridum]|nr:hypothetical protein [Gossypium aridum]
KKREKPPIVKVKLNFDAVISKDKIGFGVFAHDNEGFVVGWSYSFRVEKMQVEWAELYAFEDSIKVASSMHTTNIIFETNCTCLANRIRNQGVDITIMG